MEGPMRREFTLYPFSALVGQEKMKRALLVNAVDFRIGGLLIKGERGTGKSTAARALADLMPDIDVVADCPFSCDPHREEDMCSSCLLRWRKGEPLPVVTRPIRLITLPLNASEDRVVGTLDLEKAIKEGVKDFEPGILAEANRSILYVDEVNLLEDHIVDLLLDAAAMGVNLVEREGISYSHPSSFIMVGTMNPEEGELRPQLEDRFGLCVEVSGELDPRRRVEVIRNRQDFIDDPQLFRSRFQPQQDRLRGDILAARDRLPRIGINGEILELVSHIAVEMGACGHRADIATLQAARALAALDGSREVSERQVREAAEMALLHRLRKTPFDEQLKDMERLDRIIERKGRLIDLPLQDAAQAAPAGMEESAAPAAENSEAAAAESPGIRPQTSRAEVTLPHLEGTASKTARGTGRRSSATSDTGGGRSVGHRIPKQGEKVDPGRVSIDASLRAAAGRAAGSDKPFSIEREDLRTKVRKRKIGNLILLVLDASASMGCNDRIETTKQVVNQLLVDAYQKRDRVGLVTFRDESAQLVLSPTSSVHLARIRVKDMTAGGATPLNHGLALGYQMIKRELRRDPDIAPLLVLITDGYGNVGYASDNPLKESLDIAERIRSEGFTCVVFDTSGSAPRAGGPRHGFTQARRIAEAMGAEYHRLNELQPEDMLERLERSLRA